MACGCGWFDYGKWNSSWHTCSCDLEKPPVKGAPTGGPSPGRPSTPGPSAPGTPVTPGGSGRGPGRPAPETPGPFHPSVPRPSQPGGGGTRPGTPKTGGGVVTLYRCKETKEYCPQSERIKRITRSCEPCYTGDPRLKPPPPDCSMTKEGCEKSCNSEEFQCGPITPRPVLGGDGSNGGTGRVLSGPGAGQGGGWLSPLGRQGGMPPGYTWYPGPGRLGSSTRSRGCKGRPGGKLCFVRVYCRPTGLDVPEGLRKQMPGLPKTMHLNAVHCWFEVFNCKGESHTYEVQADKQANTPPAKGNGDKTRGWRRLGGMTEAESMIKIDSNFLASEPGQSEGTSEEFLDIYPCFSGDEDEDVCSCIHNVSENYPFRAKSEYSLPGPNSNTFVWYVANECGIALKLPPTAVGGDFLDPVGPFRDPNGRYHGIFEEWRKNRKWRFVGGKWVKD